MLNRGGEKPTNPQGRKAMLLPQEAGTRPGRTPPSLGSPLAPRQPSGYTTSAFPDWVKLGGFLPLLRLPGPSVRPDLQQVSSSLA